MLISAVIREILIILRLVTFKHAGISGLNINDDRVSMVKQACTRNTQGC